MTVYLTDIDAVTLDFYSTLVYHKQGRGRGAMLMEYLQDHGLESDPWEHQVLYDVFEQHATDYSPHFSAEDTQRYLTRLTRRLFKRLNVCVSEDAIADHVANVWRVLGPTSLAVFPDALRCLETLRRAGYKMAVISNWQCGLQHFCTELGLGELLDYVFASAEVGCAKPDPRIFRDACSRLETPCHRVLHVGDSVVDDIEGARGAGMQAVLVSRDDAAPAVDVPMIPDLERISDMLVPTEEGP
jgi:HAD superfamily hydrolase (TIGR01549 family)